MCSAFNFVRLVMHGTFVHVHPVIYGTFIYGNPATYGISRYVQPVINGTFNHVHRITCGMFLWAPCDGEYIILCGPGIGHCVSLCELCKEDTFIYAHL
jgi:hypothetical protein